MTKVSERKSVNGSCVQAARVAKVVKKGKHTAEKRKTWLKPTFRLPKTARLPRNERAISHSVKVEPTFDKYAVVKYPKSTESAMKITEDHNTLVFIVDRRANKHMIKQSINKLYTTIHRLRALGLEEHLITVGDGYALRGQLILPDKV